MTIIVLIDKHGKQQEKNVQELSKDNIYKKCGAKNKDNFEKRTTWSTKIDDINYEIELWSKSTGRANTENKFDFPPPVDKELYFGTCAIIRVKNDNDLEIMDLKVSEWGKIYENLFGGFEDLNDNETESEDELEKYPDNMKTRNGYLKDNFVVDSELEESEPDIEDEDTAIYDDDSELEEEDYV